MANPKYNVGTKNKKVSDYRAMMKRGMNAKVAKERMKQIRGKGTTGVDATC